MKMNDIFSKWTSRKNHRGARPHGEEQIPSRQCVMMMPGFGDCWMSATWLEP